jgi:hypothetical protein
MKIRKINESDNGLNLDLIKRIDDLMDNLDYLKKFVSRFKEDDIQFHSKINAIKTDIQLLSNKLNYKK